MTTTEITLKNYRPVASDILAAKLDELMDIPMCEMTDDDLELADAIGDELCKREDEDNELGQHYDSPSIQDTLPDGIYPSYAS